MRRSWLLLAPLLALLPCRGAVAPFVDGDAVCFLGDSITRGGSYHTLIEIHYAARFPERKIRWYNRGVGGDTARAIVGAAKWRLAVDTLGAKPTVVSVMLGMNDVDNGLYQPDSDQQPDIAARRAERFSQYETSLTTIVRTCQAAGARVILCTPSIYDEFARTQRPALPGRGAAVGQCAAIVRRLAASLGCELVDVHALMVAITERERPRDPGFSLIGLGAAGNDRVHPGAVGHRVIAHAFLAAQGLGTPGTGLGEPDLTPTPGIVPFLERPNAEVHRLLAERRGVGERLRDLATSRYGFAKQGRDATDDAAFLAWLGERDGTAALQGLLAQEAELNARYEALSEQARAAAR